MPSMTQVFYNTSRLSVHSTRKEQRYARKAIIHAEAPFPPLCSPTSSFSACPRPCSLLCSLPQLLSFPSVSGPLRRLANELARSRLRPFLRSLYCVSPCCAPTMSWVDPPFPSHRLGTFSVSLSAVVVKLPFGRHIFSFSHKFF